MKNGLVAGLDVGTTTVIAMIGEALEGGGFKVIGVGTSPSRGVRRGVVVNLEQTVNAIEAAVEEAELMAGVEVDEAYIGISGDHIRGMNSEGVIAVARSQNQSITEDNEIRAGDVQRVLDAAQAVTLPMDRQIVHILPQEYVVDEQYGIRNPVGMSGIRLEARVHIVTTAITSAKNLKKCVKRARMKVKELVLNPLACSYAVLDEDEKDLGVGLVDIGGGTTGVSIFFEGGVRHTGVIGLGGDNVTSDIAMMIRTPLDQAETIKHEYGCAKQSLVERDEVFTTRSMGGRPPREISRELLASYVEPRMEEILTLAHREMKKSDRYRLLTAGVVLTGGGALLDGVVELAEEILELPVKIGVPRNFGGLVDMVASPVFATSIGLVRYGLEHPEELVFHGNGKASLFGHWSRRMRHILADFFQ